MTTVRDMVKQIQADMRDGDVSPAEARELLTRATGLIGNCNQELFESEMAYNVTLADCMRRFEAANRASIETKATPEYARMLEAKLTASGLGRTVTALKGIMRSFEEEMRLSR